MILSLLHHYLPRTQPPSKFKCWPDRHQSKYISLCFAVSNCNSLRIVRCTNSARNGWEKWKMCLEWSRPVSCTACTNHPHNKTQCGCANACVRHLLSSANNVENLDGISVVATIKRQMYSTIVSLFGASLGCTLLLLWQKVAFSTHSTAAIQKFFLQKGIISSVVNFLNLKKIYFKWTISSIASGIQIIELKFFDWFIHSFGHFDRELLCSICSQPGSEPNWFNLQLDAIDWENFFNKTDCLLQRIVWYRRSKEISLEILTGCRCRYFENLLGAIFGKLWPLSRENRCWKVKLGQTSTRQYSAKSGKCLWVCLCAGSVQKADTAKRPSAHRLKLTEIKFSAV